MSKLLTVVTATYNKGERNRQSIRSILNQTYKDFEYIVVNDGSPDDTKEILAEFDDPRLTIIHQDNQGFIKTMIQVMSSIKTPYVAIHGAGDISLPDRLATQLQYLESRPNVAVVSCFTNIHIVSDQSNPKKVEKLGSNTLRERRNHVEYTTVDQMIERNIVDHGDAMVRMRAYQEFGGYRSFFVYCQDRDLWLRILSKYAIVRLRQELYTKVIDPRFDVAGNPRKAEKQALYSLFARFLARERKTIGLDRLEAEGRKSFEDYIANLDEYSKLEVSTKVFRNTLRSRLTTEDISAAREIIHRYTPKHFLEGLIITLSLMKEFVPCGASIYRFYYYQVQKRINLYKLKFSKLKLIVLSNGGIFKRKDSAKNC
ncbi:glycosyltransferase family 2 protein [Oscillatoria sp. CS-180]|uniref:glycosyltransferase family 2 protein n=1 Tax=Oscillatoria sp. CS-180 TaxID=3021720 RepID=UPI00232E62AE|nr:glycosyltransferase family 2 protein [Oscillatoria sp. CS-180]MDB9526433.1 glycosyltransferase family 2 protein [Oscillatoria sp. CS-180]